MEPPGILRNLKLAAQEMQRRAWRLDLYQTPKMPIGLLADSCWGGCSWR